MNCAGHQQAVASGAASGRAPRRRSSARVAQVDLGLVVQDQLAARDAVAQVAEQASAGAPSDPRARRRRRRGRCPSAWPRASPGRRGAAARGRCGRAREERDADARAAPRRLRRRSRSGARTPARIFHAIAAAARHVGRAGRQDRRTRRRRGARRCRSRAARRAAARRPPAAACRRVSCPSVSLTSREAVEIDDAAPRAARRRARPRERPATRSPNSVRFGEPGELVVQRPVLERLGVGLAPGDVADAADRERPLADLHPAHVHLHREARAVLAAADRLDRLRRDVAGGRQAPARACGLGEVVVVARARRSAASGWPIELVLAVAEQPPRRRG